MNKQIKATGFFQCNCATIPPTMPTQRSIHFDTCPMFWYEHIRSLEIQVSEAIELLTGIVNDDCGKLRAKIWLNEIKKVKDNKPIRKWKKTKQRDGITADFGGPHTGKSAWR